jgi:branched-chain amino acid transport system substrate-binding protein
MLGVLQQCKGDFSRTNVMRQAGNLHNMENPILLPGIKINTSPREHRPIKALQFQRWDGKTWERFGDLIEGAST